MTRRKSMRLAGRRPRRLRLRDSSPTPGTSSRRRRSPKHLPLNARDDPSRGVVWRAGTKVFGDHFLARPVRCGCDRVHKLPRLLGEDLLHQAFDGRPLLDRFRGNNLATLRLRCDKFLSGESPNGKKPNDQSSQGYVHNGKIYHLGPVLATASPSGGSPVFESRLA